MIASAIHKVVRQWNYELFSPAVRVVGWLAMFVHLFSYLFLHFNSTNVESLGGRLLAIALLCPLVAYPRRGWQPYHKIYYEAAIAVSLPGFFTYTLLLNSANITSSAALFLAVLLYGVLSKHWAAMVLYPVSVLGTLLVYYLNHLEQFAVFGPLWAVLLFSMLVLAIVLALKWYIEKKLFEQAAMKERADQQNAVFSALFDISVEVSRYDDLDEIFPLMLQRFETIFPGRGFGLLIEGPRPKIILHMAFRSIEEKDASFLLKVHPYVLGFADVYPENEQEQLSSLDGQEWHVFGGGINSSSIQGEMVYCFKLFIKGEGFNEDEQRILQVFLELIRGMVRARIQAMELERYSNTDQLTGLYNRNYFTHIIGKWQEKRHPDKPYAVIFGDVNELKRINDTYGHRAGDGMIRTCADLLQETVRRSDMVFRHGGDELVILCPATTLAQAQELIERIERRSDNLMVQCEDEDTGEVHVEQAHISLGVACSTEEGVVDVVSLADQRMFAAKQQWYEQRGLGKYR